MFIYHSLLSGRFAQMRCAFMLVIEYLRNNFIFGGTTYVACIGPFVMHQWYV
jgi:hypothetical protein